MTAFRRSVFGLLFWVFILGAAARGSVTHEVLTNFILPPQTPGHGGLTLGPDGYYWGTTQYGGTYTYGTVFKISADGREWQTVLSFSGNGTINKGSKPDGTLVSDGNGYLWGVTGQGGPNEWGTIFKVEASTGVLTTVVEFAKDSTKNLGQWPRGGLVSDGAGFLWGTTSSGSSTSVLGGGTIFKVNVTTGELTTVANFSAIGNSGTGPVSALISDGNGYLWGTTMWIGSQLGGTVFKINVSTGVLTTVAEFRSGPGGSKGNSPVGSLVRDGAYIWGTTARGGVRNLGTIFKIDTSTGVLTTLIEFSGIYASPREGSVPEAGLVSDGAGYLWGTTKFGGAHGFGTLFKLNASTGELTTIIEFTGQGTPNTGSAPCGLLLNDGKGNLLGTTSAGGALDYGTVFRLEMASGTLTTLFEFPDSPGKMKGAIPISGLSGDGGDYLWGATTQGGAYGHGTIYKVNARNGELTTVIEFTGDGLENKGSTPASELLSDGQGFFWGITQYGGASDAGTVFKIDASTGVLTTVVEFYTDVETRGALPTGGLAVDDWGFLWGTTARGGEKDAGTIYIIDPSTGEVFTIVDFTRDGDVNRGALPYATMLNDGSGFLWGTTSLGGLANRGTVFKIDTNTGVLTTVVEFVLSGRGDSGGFPFGALVSDGAGSFLGTTTDGTVFKLNAITGVVTTLVRFDPIDQKSKGVTPYAGLVADGTGAFLGTNSSTVFRINPATGEFATVLEFTGPGNQPGSGQSPAYGSLYRHTDGHFYGTTMTGGAEGGGTLYRLRVGPVPDTQPADQITRTSARLKAVIHPNAAPTEVVFRWGTHPHALGSFTSPIHVGNGTAAVNVETTISGLLPETTYYYRATSTNLHTNVSEGGATLSFTTATPPPTVVTTAPANVTTTGAVLRATVNPNGQETTVKFYLCDTLCGTVVVPPGRRPTTVELPVTGLNPVAVYQVRVSVANASGTADGETISFGTVPLTVPLYLTGSGVPGAGQAESGIPNGAVWKKFGIPAINDAHQVAFLGTWTSPSGSGSGIFVDDVLLVKNGDPVPGSSGLVFRDFVDPVLNEDGRVAFLATVAGAGVTAANNTVVVSDGLDAASSTLRVVARTGEIAPGTGSARFKKFTGVAVAGSQATSAGLVLEGLLTAGTGLPRTTGKNDSAVWQAYGEGAPALSLTLREGTATPGLDAGETPQAFKLLMPTSGSPGQGRALAFGAAPGLTVKLSSGRQVLMRMGESPAALVFSGEPFGGATPDWVRWKSFGPLSTATDGFAVRGVLQTTPSVKPGQTTGIFNGNIDANAWESVVRIGDAAPGLGEIIFSALKDPVLAPAGGAIAFAAVLKGKGVTAASDTSLWWRRSGGGLEMLAREGTPAPGGGVWKDFTSLAIAGGTTGPIFAGTLKRGSGGIDATKDTGVWGTDSTGAVQLFFREGDIVAGKQVKSFTVLKAVVGSPGVTRAFNSRAEIVWRADFVDGWQGVLLTRIP